MDYNLFDKALIFAAKAHEGQYRKGTDVPYITHPVGLAVTLMDLNCADEVIVAALLHDVVEDTIVTLDEIEVEFGGQVAGLVGAVSEPDRDAPWEVRKEHTINKLRHASLSVKLLACADKLYNIRSMAQDYAAVGEQIWERFNRGKEKQAWYYRFLTERLIGGLEKSERYQIFAEYRQQAENLCSI